MMQDSKRLVLPVLGGLAVALTGAAIAVSVATVNAGEHPDDWLTANSICRVVVSSSLAAPERVQEMCAIIARDETAHCHALRDARARHAETGELATCDDNVLAFQKPVPSPRVIEKVRALPEDRRMSLLTMHYLANR